MIPSTTLTREEVALFSHSTGSSKDFQLYNALSPRQKEVITLRFGLTSDPLTQEETAEALGTKRETVRSHERKALKRMEGLNAYLKRCHDFIDPCKDKLKEILTELEEEVVLLTYYSKWPLVMIAHHCRKNLLTVRTIQSKACRKIGRYRSMQGELEGVEFRPLPPGY